MATEAIIRAPRDTAADWSSINPILKLGELGLETDTSLLKWGNGSGQWNTRPYITVRYQDVLYKPTTLAGYGITDALSTSAIDTDPALTANSDTRIASQKATKAYIDNAVTGVLKFRGSTDCSANPNYPPALKGDAYIVTVAGKIGGASGKTVDVGDVYFANAANAGGTEASVGASWSVLEHNLVGALLAGNNLSDLTNAATARTNLGYGQIVPNGVNIGIGSGVTATAKFQVGATSLASSTQVGMFAISDVSNANRRVVFTFDSTLGANGMGVISCLVAGVAWCPLLLNPNGGVVGTGTAANVLPGTSGANFYINNVGFAAHAIRDNQNGIEVYLAAGISGSDTGCLIGSLTSHPVFFRVNNATQASLTTAAFAPVSDVTKTLGTSALRWLSGYIAALYTGIRTVTATVTVGVSDSTILCNATSGAIVVNLPAASSSAGRTLVIKKIDSSANTVTLDGSGAETIDGAATKVISTQWSSLTIQCDGTAWFIL